MSPGKVPQMKRANNMLNASKLMLAVALFGCAAWQLPSHTQAQATNEQTPASSHEATPSQEVLVPLARGVLGQPLNDKPELVADEVIPVVAKRWTAKDEVTLWLSYVDAKLIAAGIVLLLAALFARHAARKAKARRVEDESGEVNRPSYI